jgi:hypothetical protein
MLAPKNDDNGDHDPPADQQPKQKSSQKARSNFIVINRKVEDELFRLLKSMNSETVYHDAYFIVNTVSYKRVIANGDFVKMCAVLTPIYSPHKHKYINRVSYTYANFMTVIRYVIGILSLSYENVKTYTRGKTTPSYWIINPYNE